jgi:hypothetical protein
MCAKNAAFSLWVERVFTERLEFVLNDTPWVTFYKLLQIGTSGTWKANTL